jgi:hypothetical protein
MRKYPFEHVLLASANAVELVKELFASVQDVQLLLAVKNRKKRIKI